MAPSLRNHPTGQREIRGAHVIGVIGVVLRMAHHELWLHRTNDIHHLILRLLAQVQWIIPKVQKFNVMHVQRMGGILCLFAANGFHLIKRFPSFHKRALSPRSP